MTLQNLKERARAIVHQTLLGEGDPEVDRSLVSGAVVARDGDHFHIQSGGETDADLDLVARRDEGLCDCGGPLSTRGNRARCRSCGREFDV
ncbi:MAG: hypothetical protein JRG76_13755 [Deltaproteobacteria bacterium]|nr:hypothetical protein [Deltaproteobacteria bacterium]MBW2415565.1 hypothetical protein [Deltaproteobacteria bacterium]